MNTFIPNFNLHSIIPDDDDQDEAEMRIVPSEDELMKEYELQSRSFGGIINQNCTVTINMNINPHIINKVVNKGRRVQILESDEED
jgi:hypothetical protein